MRCLLLVLVALLKVQALRTEPLDLAARAQNVVELTKDEDSSSNDMRIPRTLTEIQDRGRLPPTGEDNLRRIFSVDTAATTDVEDERYDDDYLDEQLKAIDQLDDTQLQRLANYMLKVLQRPNVYEAPVLFIPKDFINEPYSLELEDLKSVAKRTRYYRRYPWKRQNSRNYQTMDYDPYNTCTLTRNDVFKLLVALHDARQGNKSRIVNFCNRKRPASAVYTNIRFLGRRRK